MEGTSVIKLSLFGLLLIAFASYLSPNTAEARNKHEVYHSHFHHPMRPYPVHPLPAASPAPETPPTLPSYAPSPTDKTSAPPPYDTGIDTPPSEFQGCGFPCRDSYDCYGSCPICCSNQTCCSDQSIAIPLPPSAAPSPPPISPANSGAGMPTIPSPGSPPSPQSPYITDSNGFQRYNDEISIKTPPTDTGLPPGYVPLPYQVHGCGYPCNDSDDCDSPCTVCCGDGKNNTCCYDY